MIEAYGWANKTKSGKYQITIKYRYAKKTPWKFARKTVAARNSKAADKVAANLVAETKAGIINWEQRTDIQKTSTQNIITVKSLFTKYLDAKSGELEPATIEWYDKTVELIPDWFLNSDAAKSTLENVEMVRAGMMAKGLANSTINVHMGKLEAVQRYTRDRGHPAIVVVKLSKLKVSKKKITNRYLTPKQRKQAIEIAKRLDKGGYNFRHELMLRLGLELGLRISEIVGLKWDKISFVPDPEGRFKNGYVIIDEKKSKTNEMGPVKTEADILELSNSVKDILQKMERRGDFVFGRKGGKTITYQSMVWSLKKIWKELGLDDWATHRMRHTCATDLGRAGLGETEISSITRHRSRSALVAYLHTDRMQSQARQRLENWRNEK